MNVESLITLIVVGGVAGFLASHLMRSRGFGPLGNIALGIVGAVVGGFVFGLLGIMQGGLVGSIVSATVGAALVLGVVAAVKKL